MSSREMLDDEEPTVYGRITDEGLEALRRRLGKEYPIEQPFLRYVNSDSIAHVARAIGDANPLWIDAAHAAGSRYGRLVAPPAFLYGVGWGSWDLRRGDGLPGVHALHCRDHWFLYRPMLAGDEIRGTKKFTTLEVKDGAYAGRSVIQSREMRFFNQQNEPVARCLMSGFRVERHLGKEKAKYKTIAKYRYTDEEIEAIDRAIAAEIVRGAEPRYFEDVRIGEKLQPLVRGPLTIADMIAWMMGIGSPHIRSGQYWLDYRRRAPKIAVPDPVTNVPEAVERVHWDPFMAGEIGMPGCYDYGSQRGAWATHFATNWCGDNGWVAQVEVEYRGMNFVGDTVTIGGEVMSKWISPRSGIGFVLCSIAAVNQRGINIMPGRALIALPQKGKPLPHAIPDHDAEAPV